MWCTIWNTILNCARHQSSIITVNIGMKLTNGVLSDEAEHTQGSNMGSMYQFLSAKCQTRNVKEIPQWWAQKYADGTFWVPTAAFGISPGPMAFRYVALDAMRPKGRPALQKFYNTSLTSSLVQGKRVFVPCVYTCHTQTVMWSNQHESVYWFFGRFLFEMT